MTKDLDDTDERMRAALVDELHIARERFLALVGEVRPDLHRYCARMTGSISDGEDIVQDTLAYAYYAVSEVNVLPPLRSWLFQIAHRRSIDYLRRYERRMARPLDDSDETPADASADPEDTLARDEALSVALSAFGKLPATQRSCVILKDVLGHSLEEIAALIGLTVPATKAALHRGRSQLRERAQRPAPSTPRRASPAIARYAELFNARDWDGVRDMLAEDVRLDLVSRSQRTGRRDVGSYLTNYAARHDWRFAPAWLEGREILAVFRRAEDERPSYFVELAVHDERVTAIRDFRYVPYITQDADITLAEP